jgi:hypothetical protein
MSDTEIRLKVELTQECKRRLNLTDTHEYLKFWFYIDTNQFATVEQFQHELFKRIVSNIAQSRPASNRKGSKIYKHIDSRQLRLFIQNCELPPFESTSLMRDMDTVVSVYNLFYLN